MPHMCYAGGFAHRFYSAMFNYHRARKSESWEGKAAEAYRVRYEELHSCWMALMGILNELDAAKAQLEARV